MKVIAEFNGQYRFLSNFYPSPVRFEEEWYPTVEHAYQAAKTLDPALRRSIARFVRPGAAKIQGRTLRIREDWEAIKLDVMLELVRIKFQEPRLQKALLETEDAELIEGNSWGDRFWGKVNGVGENHLGRILMQVRGELNNDKTSSSNSR